MRVGITGATGFIGKEIVALMGDTSLTPVIIGRQQITSRYESRKTDYSTDSLTDVLGDIDAVIHLAAVRGAQASIGLYHQNEIITENLYESCARRGIRNIVFASSISVYSDVLKIPWSEIHLPSPKTLYGVSKISCEYIGDIMSKRYDLHIKSLRIAQVLGEGERKGYMMNTFIDNAFMKKQITVKGKSIAKREYVYVKDVARAFLLALAKENLKGSFNIGSNAAYTNIEIALIVNSVFCNTVSISYQDTVDENIESSYMDSEKAALMLGYTPSWTLENALLDIRYYKEQNTENVDVSKIYKKNS